MRKTVRLHVIVNDLHFLPRCIFFFSFPLFFIFLRIFTAFDKADFDVKIYRVPFDHDGIHVTPANAGASKISKKIRKSLKISR